ncbi:uncharacterized protein LOC126694415 [Quercus robur]|uniref:uncharacterized protein LOC126694415 n=1 Tax=Quercus robur TaxID=38942 RepID=UPI002163D02E|nr:uncharacterized protein LOC126694415 [Quercus robur]
MHALWVSLKENFNCGVKLTGVVRPPGTCYKKRSPTTEKDKLESELVHSTKVICKQNSTRTLLSRLNTGDPSRNIVEMIFQRASMNPTKPSTKIKTVLKVKNSAEIVERFEKYRERVKKKAYEQYKRHPRSTVDGNELLRFYGTTIVCYSEKSKRVSELCRDPSCGACRIIQSKFDTDYTRRNGVQLNTSSEDLSENMNAATSVKNIKRAAIVCRTIAGSIVNVVDGEYLDFDSVGSEGLLSNLKCLILRNPSAVLPCFIVVFD